MSNEIVRRGTEDTPSFEDFRANLISRSAGITHLEKAADAVDSWPVLIRAAANLDPTGGLAAVAQILSENRAGRIQENLLWALYQLEVGFRQHSEILEQLEGSYLEVEVLRLTERYFEESAKTLIASKIETFRNIWLNGLLKVDRSFSEKSIVFDIVGELTEDEIEVLRYFWKRTNESDTSRRGVLHIGVGEVAEALGVDNVYAQQLCVRLRKHGLVSDTTTGMTIGTGPPRRFAIMDFAKTLLEYTLEPSAVEHK